MEPLGGALTGLRTASRALDRAVGGEGRQQSERKIYRRTTAAAEMRRRGTKPGAREWFVVLLPHLLASRPVVGHTVETFHADGSKTGGEPIYGKPAFRNVIENGKLK